MISESWWDVFGSKKYHENDFGFFLHYFYFCAWADFVLFDGQRFQIETSNTIQRVIQGRLGHRL